eukprot:10737330-Prorocentrum_lima.AAC.1
MLQQIAPSLLRLLVEVLHRVAQGCEYGRVIALLSPLFHGRLVPVRIGHGWQPQKAPPLIRLCLWTIKRPQLGQLGVVFPI